MQSYKNVNTNKIITFREKWNKNVYSSYNSDAQFSLDTHNII